MCHTSEYINFTEIIARGNAFRKTEANKKFLLVKLFSLHIRNIIQFMMNGTYFLKYFPPDSCATDTFTGYVDKHFVLQNAPPAAQPRQAPCSQGVGWVNKTGKGEKKNEQS
jgi:hypothetical protein